MKVIYKNQDDNTVFLKDVKFGQLFKEISNKHIYIKTYNSHAKYEDWMQFGTCLKTGTLCMFDENSEVVKVNASLVVE